MAHKYYFKSLTAYLPTFNFVQSNRSVEIFNKLNNSSMLLQTVCTQYNDKILTAIIFTVLFSNVTLHNITVQLFRVA